MKVVEIKQNTRSIKLLTPLTPKLLSHILLPKGCGIEAESPQRSEDLQRKARTKVDSSNSVDSPSFSIYLKEIFALK
jgi:hypothetical protein